MGPRVTCNGWDPRLLMYVLPVELWTQVFQETEPRDRLKQLTTCRLFHSLLQAKLYEDVRLTSGVNEDNGHLAKAPQSALFVQTLTARPELFSLVRKLQFIHQTTYLFDDKVMPEDNVGNHPVLWQLPYFPHLRSLSLIGIHIGIDCYTAISSIPRREYLEVEGCDIDTALLDLQPFRGSTVMTLFVDRPEGGHGWAALMISGLCTLIVENTYEDVHMGKVLRGLLSCDLHRTLTKLEWTLEAHFHKELCQFIEPCALIESLSIEHRFYPRNNAAIRSSHVEELSPKALPILSEFRGTVEYATSIIAGRPVHSVSLQVWHDTPKDILSALQFSSVPVTRLILSQGGEFNSPSTTGLYLVHAPKTIEILSLEDEFDKEKVRSCIPALSKLTHLQTIEYAVISETLAHDIELMQCISEACPSIRKFLFTLPCPLKGGKRMWRNDGTWEHY